MPTILYEGLNLSLTRGTGIATYAANLGKAARALGYRTGALVSAPRRLRPNDRDFNEIALLDEPGAACQPLELLHRAFGFVAGAPFGLRGVNIPAPGGVVRGVPEQLKGFEDIVASTGLFDIARSHFNRWGRRAIVKLDQPPQVFHATHPVPLRVRDCPNIYTIHDIIPLRLPQTTLDNKAYFLGLIRHLCREADHIVTVSEFSRRDIIELTGIGESRITNTGQAVDIADAQVRRPMDDVANELARCYGLDVGGYFLFVGALEPKKNLERLVEAFAGCGSACPLIVVGGIGWQCESILAKLDDQRFERFTIDGTTMRPSRQVRRLDYVPRDRLISLMRGARALVFPSLYEGFGVPVLEAMTLGTPVLASNVSSLPEIAGDAAVLVDPYDVDAMADGLRRLDRDGDLRAELARRGPVQAQRYSIDAYRARLGALYARLTGAPTPLDGGGPSGHFGLNRN